MTRIPTLDSWRGAAILLVLADHAALSVGLAGPRWMNGLGQHGVTIFFVLSGYLITAKLLSERSATGRVDLREFYRRRILRLMPAAWCYLALAALITLVQHQRAWKEIIAALLFFRNYVDVTGGHELTGHFWSLSIEEQFYLVWPAILITIPLRILRFMVAVTACALAAFRFLVLANGAMHPLLLPCETQFRADALLVGCLLAMSIPQGARWIRGWMCIPLLIALVTCIAMNHRFVPLYESVVIALLLAGTSLNPGSVFSRCLDTRPLRLLGAVSYSLYLWQQVVFLSVRGHVLRLMPGLICLAIVAALSYVCIERPVREFGRRGGVENRAQTSDSVAAA